MFRAVKWIAPAVALAIALSFTVSRTFAEDAKKETGSVAGVVTDVAGKPVSHAEVALYHQMARKDKPSATGAEKQSTGATIELADKPAKGEKPIPLATATTDGDGKFTMTDVAVGDYTVIARLKGTGSARQNLSVKAGEVAKAELQFKPKKSAPKPSEK